jgi:hypothetical protein
MRRYVLTFLGAALFAFGAAVAMNLAVDHNGVLALRGEEGRRTLERYVAKLRSSSAGLVMIYQDRQVKAELARQSDDDCFILGSSQTFFFDAQTTPYVFEGCRGVTNLALSVAGFEDFVALSGILAEKPVKSRIVVGVAPWLLKANPDTSWTEYEDVWRQGLQALGLPKTSAYVLPSDWKIMFNGAYALENFHAELERLTQRRPDRAAQALYGIEAGQATEEDAVILPNGRIVYPPEPAPDPRTLGDGAINIFAPEIEPEAVSQFESALRNLIARGHGVTLLITPYHPIVMACRNPLVCATLQKVETQAREIAARLDVRLIGSFDPRPFELGPQDYLDEMHLGLSGVSKLRQVDGNPWRAARTTKARATLSRATLE